MRKCRILKSSNPQILNAATKGAIRGGAAIYVNKIDCLKSEMLFDC